MNINEIIAALPSMTPFAKQAITCADGFTMSVQASSFHYCEPRRDNGPWSKFEIGFPSEVEPLILDYAEDREDPTETVYGWVPGDVIEQVIAKHGGLKEGV